MNPRPSIRQLQTTPRRPERGSWVWWFLWIVVGLCLDAVPGEAQPAEDLLVTSGVIGRNSAGQPQAYLVWGGSNPLLTSGRTFALYQKPGLPDAAGPFLRQGIIVPATSEAAAATAVAQAQSLSLDLPSPANLVEVLVKSAGLPPAPGLAAGLATLANAVRSNPLIRSNLETVIPSHPALALALGRAWTGPLPEGPSTFELREWDPLTARDLRPVGRVILDTRSPSILPAPGVPLQVPDLSPAGNLIIRLRWAVPSELRRRSPLQLGFNLWRMPRTEAEARGLLIRPPSIAELKSTALRLNDFPIFASNYLTPAEAADTASDRTTSFFSDDNGRSEPGGVPFPEGSEFVYFVTGRDLLGQDGLSSPAGTGRACLTLPPPTPLNIEVSSLLHSPAPDTVRQAFQISWQSVANSHHYEVFRSPDPVSLESGVPMSVSATATIPAGTSAGRLTWIDDVLAAGPIPGGTAVFYSVRAVRLTPCGPVVSPLSPPARASWRDFTPPPAPRGSVEPNCPQPAVRYQSTSQSPLKPTDPSTLTNAAGVVLRRHQVAVERRDRGIAWTRISASDASGPVFSSPPIWFAPDEDLLEIPLTRPLVASGGVFLNLVCEVGTASGRSTSVSYPERASGEIVETRFLAAEISSGDLLPSDPLAATLLERASAESSPTCLGLQPVGNPGPDGTLALLRDRSTPARYLVQDRSANPVRRIGVFSAEAPPPGAPALLVIRDPLLIGWNPSQSVPSYCAYVVLDPTSQHGEPVECNHESHAEGTDRITGPRLRVQLDSRAREFRLYRRIDDGPLTLIGQGPVAPDPSNPGQAWPVLREDQTMPEAGGRLCYFAQAVDADGNGSVLSTLGCVVTTGGTLPVPVLSRPEAEGDVQQARVRLHWTCPIPGVSRFEVFLQPDKATKVVGGGSSGGGFSVIKTVADPPVTIHRTRDPFGKIVQVSVPADRLVTDAIGSPGLGEGPQFSLSAEVEIGVPYTIFIRALSPGPLFLARRGAPSFSYRFTWARPPGNVDGEVPWPQRPLPPVNPFHPDIQALQVPAHARLWPTNAEEAPVGIRIGRLRVLDRDVTDRSQPAGSFYPLATVPRSIALAPVDPNLGLFPEIATPVPRTNTWVLPAVLYRQQVTNTAYPTVSGDLTQVSPLVGALTWETQTLGNDLQVAWLRDPFILVSRHLLNGDVSGGPPDLWLLDTHPVITGARYRYWLVRFQKSGEPDVIIPAGEVEIQ